MGNRFTIILVVLFIGFAGIFLISKKNSQESGNDTKEVTTTSYVQGSENAKVTLVEYGDFECPACGQYFPILQEVKAKYKDSMSFQFRHFPIVQIHRNAMAAHKAAEAAAKQNKFFEMHDLLYGQQQTWANQTNTAGIFEGFASQLGLDMEQFKKDIASQEVNDTINADIREGQKAGVSGTPTFFLNGKKIEQNPRDLESFNKLIEDALKQQ